MPRTASFAARLPNFIDIPIPNSQPGPEIDRLMPSTVIPAPLHLGGYCLDDAESSLETLKHGALRQFVESLGTAVKPLIYGQTLPETWQ